MFIHASKKISAAMYVQHDTLAIIVHLLPVIIIAAHLNPLCLQFALVSSPLPPQLPSDAIDSIMAQLRN